ncbi:F5/8 type C domain-containing protein [Fodinibius roseus]|uniref:F5/8 type C domain-containing protein n=2 Tax=Fodinibius roseus TaxID=1194090 RepID=A0A1M4V4X0_9BACT|nr:F5/8 type C domain-containing protein [Fodinibius roseus]
MNRIIFFSLVALLLITTACSDNFLQTEPNDRLSDGSFWNTEEDAELAANALYDHLKTAIFRWDSISDIGKPNTPSSSASQNVQGLQSSTSGYGRGIWGNSYEAIRAVNDYLVKIDRVESDNTALLDRYRAEARFIRAYQYSYLLMFYGDVPFITEPISISEAKELTRTDKAEIWDFVSSELQEISEVLPESYSDNDQGRITRGAALAWKARAMLWAGRYEEAAAAAQAVMDSGVYELYPSYQDLFSYEAEHNSGVILNKEYIKNEDSNSLFDILAPFSQKSSGSTFVPTKSLVDAYEMANGMKIDDPGSGYDPASPYENRDPRLRYSMFVYGDVLPDGQIYDPRPGLGGPDDIMRSFTTTSTGFNIKKYVNDQDLEDPSNGGINIILQRYAEILLTYAEAKIELGEIDQSVYDAINEVRQRPDVEMPAIQSPKSQEELRQIVRHERKVELAFEGLRYFDIRRWEIAPEVMNGPIRGITSVQNTYADRSDWEVIDFSSDNEPRGNVASNIIDDDVSTIWHTAWVNSNPPHPHYITIDMGDRQEIIGFRIRGRQGYNDGNPQDIYIEVSSNGNTWEHREDFTLNNVGSNTVYTSSARQAQYFRMTVESSFGGTTHTHVAEIEVITAQATETWVYPEYERSFGEKDYFLPIPDEELTLNPNLEQNPGY